MTGTWWAGVQHVEVSWMGTKCVPEAIILEAHLGVGEVRSLQWHSLSPLPAFKHSFTPRSPHPSPLDTSQILLTAVVQEPRRLLSHSGAFLLSFYFICESGKELSLPCACLWTSVFCLTCVQFVSACDCPRDDVRALWCHSTL